MLLKVVQDSTVALGTSSTHTADVLNLAETGIKDDNHESKTFAPYHDDVQVCKKFEQPKSADQLDMPESKNGTNDRDADLRSSIIACWF